MSHLTLLCSAFVLGWISQHVVAENSEWSWIAISEYQECSDLSKFEPSLLGYWKGRTQMTETEYLLEHDIHNIKADGTGVVNKKGGPDNTLVMGATPDKMWCRKHPNGFNKEVKVQYGPSDIGLMVCIDLQLRDENTLEVRTNIALFTDPRLVATCLTYAMRSMYDSYTIWVDTVSTHKISHQIWTKTTRPHQQDWVGEEQEINSDPVSVGIQVEGGRHELTATYEPPSSGNTDQQSGSSGSPDERHGNAGADRRSGQMSEDRTKNNYWAILKSALGGLQGRRGGTAEKDGAAVKKETAAKTARGNGRSEKVDLTNGLKKLLGELQYGQ